MNRIHRLTAMFIQLQSSGSKLTNLSTSFVTMATKIFSLFIKYAVIFS